MLQLVAIQKRGKWDVQLCELPPRAVVELRIQNTMNGRERIVGCEANFEGIASVPFDDFGQYYAINARVLSENNDEVLHPLHFTAESKADHYVMMTDVQSSAVDDGSSAQHASEG